MARKFNFERYLEYKADEIDNAAYSLAAALLRCHPDETNEEVLPWDMSVIAPIIEAAQKELERLDKQTCFPYFEEAKECYRIGSCNNKRCYLADKGGIDTE